MALTLRNVKGSRLTFTELDGNFTYLEGLDLSGVTYNVGTELLTLTRNNGGTLTTTIPSGGGTDIFVTGGTADVSSSTLTFTNSTGGTFNVANSAALFSDNDINVTGGTYNPTNGCVTFVTNSGTTFDVCGFLTGMTDTYVSGYSYNDANTFTISQTDGSSYSASIDTVTGLTSTGNVIITGTSQTLTINDYSLPTIGGTEGEVMVIDDSGDLIFHHGERLDLQVRNDEGVDLDAGTPVYSKGEIGGSNRIKVGKADASDPSKMPAIGVLAQDLDTAGNKDGYAVVTGVLNENITGFVGLSDGDTVYVASGGTLTITKPIGTNLIQNMGIILKTNGTIIQGLKVSSIDRTNDVPNIQENYLWLGNSDGVATPTDITTIIPEELDDLIDVDTSGENIILANQGSGVVPIVSTGTYNFVALSSAFSLGGGATGSDNIVIGHLAARNKGAGSSNIFLGKNVIGTPGGGTPSNNIIMGEHAGYNLLSPTDNVIIGNAAFSTTTSGNANTIVGTGAGSGQVYHSNVFIGYEAGKASPSYGSVGGNKVAIGYRAGYNVVDYNNIAIGSQAGYNTAIGASYYTGRNNIMIGAGVLLSGTTTWNQLIVGALDKYLLSGDFNTTDRTKLGVNISNDIPTANLQVKGHASDATTLLVQDGSDNTLVSVDNVGNLHVTGRTTTENFTMLSGATDGYVLTSDVGGNGRWAAATDVWSFTGNTSGSCISDIWVSNIHSCSPLNINPGDEGNVYFGSSSGVTINVADERLGIGTAGSTNYKLWVKESSTDVQGKIESDNGYARWIIDSHDTNDSILQFNEAGTRRWQIAVDGADDGLKFTRSDITAGSVTSALLIDASDNVGIGTESPAQKLHVSGTTRIDGALIINGQGNTYATTNFLIENSNGDQIMKLTDAGDNILIGKDAGDTITAGSGLENVLIGLEAGSKTTGGTGNIFIGSSAGASVTAGYSASNNIAIGKLAGSSLESNTPTDNVFVGYSAGRSNTIYQYNTYVGHQSGENNDRDSNTAVGYQALQCSAIGGPWNSQGNVGIGFQAGSALTSGRFNTFVGYRSGGIVAGTNQIAIGNGATSPGSNTIEMGNSSITTADIQVAWTVLSDERTKKDVLGCDLGLDFIKDLSPKKYRRRHPGDYPYAIKEDRYKSGGNQHDNSNSSTIYDTYAPHDNQTFEYGLLAQDVKSTISNNSNYAEFDGWKEMSNGRQGLKYQTFIPPIIKAIQELSFDMDNIDSVGVEKFLTGGTYNSSTKEIELTLNTGDLITIPANDLLDNTNNYVLTGTSSNNILTLTRKDLPDIIIPVGGLQGPAGADGSDGTNGVDGATGSQGVAGNDGATGPQGLSGATGAQGIAGADGQDGATGPQGLSGATGAQGIAGADGQDGTIGPQGLSGATGAQGIAGIDGQDGADGAIGPQGLSGATGAQGEQ